MPYGGLDWLAQTPEAPLEPELPIIDPHHHFWDRRTPRIPYAKYELAEILGDIGEGHNVVGTVFIEARSMYRPDLPAELRGVGEVQYVNGIAAASASGLYGPSRVAAGIVGRADLGLGADVGRVLEALQAAAPERFRGIRHSTARDPHPEIDNPVEPHLLGQMGSEAFREGARVLARMGLSYDAWLFHHQLHEAVDFARAVPELPIVLNHIGGLLRVGPYASRLDEVHATWRQGIADLATCPNVVVKLGGLGMPRFGFGFDLREVPIGSEELAKTMEPWLAYVIEQFGPERCMFESNFPVDKVSFGYGVMWNAFKRLSAGHTPAERASMFHDTAARFYRLDV